VPALGPDGSLYLLFADEAQNVKQAMLSCFDPSGEKLWRVGLGVMAIEDSLRGLGVDGEGRVVVLLTDLMGDRGVLLCVSSDGADVEELAELPMLIAHGSRIVVGPDGDMHHYARNARRIFTTEGRLSWRNDEAREQDQKVRDW